MTLSNHNLKSDLICVVTQTLFRITGKIPQCKGRIDFLNRLCNIKRNRGFTCNDFFAGFNALCRDFSGCDRICSNHFFLDGNTAFLQIGFCIRIILTDIIIQGNARLSATQYQINRRAFFDTDLPLRTRVYNQIPIDFG